MDADRERWDERYIGRDVAPPARPEALDGGLVAHVPTAGRALDVACGTGGQTVWLAARGLTVVALDVSPEAIRLTTAAAEAVGCAARVEARVHDLDGGLPAGLGDVDVVLCQRFRDTGLYRPILDLLRPGGIGIVTVLSEVGRTGPPRPFHAPPGELRAAFATGATVVLAEREEGGVGSIVFRRC